MNVIVILNSTFTFLFKWSTKPPAASTFETFMLAKKLERRDREWLPLQTKKRSRFLHLVFIWGVRPAQGIIAAPIWTGLKSVFLQLLHEWDLLISALIYLVSVPSTHFPWQYFDPGHRRGHSSAAVYFCCDTKYNNDEGHPGSTLPGF